MFIEPAFGQERRGWIEVICGSMFSGKTEELIRRLRRTRIAGLKTQVFRPAADTRHEEQKIVSHDENQFVSVTVSSSGEIPSLSEGADVVAVDEAQFFDEGLVGVCDSLAFRGKRVIVAGLDMDYLGNPFGPMPKLLAKAEYITKLHAICVRCGNIASFSYRKSTGGEQIMIGNRDLYEPRCRHCFGLGDLLK